jgi:hypothetical protein
MFGQPAIVAIHEVLVHIFRISAGWRSATHGFGYFSNMYGGSTAANTQISDVMFPGFAGKMSYFVAVAI